MIYDDSDEGKETMPLPAMRPYMDAPDTGQAETVPALSPGEMGHSRMERTESRTTETKDSGFVYFAETTDGNFVKIGFSKHPHVRMSELATLRPGSFALRLIGSITGTRHTESWLHMLFTHDRDNGEWFRSTARLRAFIDTLQLMPPIHLREYKHHRPKPLKTQELLSEMTESKNEAAQELARKRWDKTSPKKRAEIARALAAARWEGHKAKRPAAARKKKSK